MVKIMKKQTLISIYNIATVIFALLTLVSLGSAASMPLYTVVTNTMLFGLLTMRMAEKEAQLKKELRRKHHKPALSVYSHKPARRVA